MKKFLKISLPILVWVMIILPIVSLAQANTGGNPGPGNTGGNPGGTQSSGKITIPNPLRSEINSIPKLIEVIIKDVVVPIGAVVAVLMIMYAGFLYVTARGNPTQIAKAHQALLFACIGAAILLGARLLAEAIQGTINQLK